MNVENFIDYQLSEIFFANSDWPGNNNRCWREHVVGSPFEWLIFDLDHGFKNHSHNTLLHATDDNSPSWQNSPQSTLLLRELLENETFENRFIARFCDLLNFNFKSENMLAFIDSLSAGIELEIPYHIDRWYPDHNWQAELDWLRDFAENREDFIQQDFEDYFDLDGSRFVYIDCENPAWGSISLNGFPISNFPKLVNYYQGLDLELSAEPNSGYVFDGWTGDYNSNLALLPFTVNNNLSIQCSFSPIDDYDGAVVITEINYHSSDDFDTGDWIELFVLGGDYNLGGWQLKDENDEHLFEIPDGMILHAGQFLVLARSLEEFQNYHPSVQNVIGSFEFGLGNGGDIVRLYDQNLVLIDSVAYSDDPPWPVQADGNGSTLQLFDPELPNEFVHNWEASLTMHGTPGRWLEVNPGGLYGDLNIDGAVDVLDIVIAVQCVFEFPGLDCTYADMDSDGTVDILDIVIMVGIIVDDS